MNRLGFDKDEIYDLCDFLLIKPEIKVEGIFEIFILLVIKKMEKNLTIKQINNFQKLANLIESKIKYQYY